MKPICPTSTDGKSTGFTLIDLNVALIASEARRLFWYDSVSYTHLTLPTTAIV